MRRAALLLVVVPLLSPAQDAGRVAREAREAVTLDGASVGVVRSLVRGLDAGKRQHLQEMKLSLRRGTATVELRQEWGVEEDAAGKVVSVFLRQYQGSKLALEVTGSVDPKSPDRLDMVKDGKQSFRVAWRDEVWRPGDLSVAPGKGGWQPGDRQTVRLFEPTYCAVATYTATAQEREQMNVEGKLVSVLPLNLVPEPLVGGNQRVTLPVVRWWLDDAGRVVRREMDMPGLGMLTLRCGDKGSAGAPAVNLLERGLIPLDKLVARPLRAAAARLRVTLKDIPDAATAFVSDEHQTVRELQPGVLDVVIHPVGDQVRNEPAPAKEYSVPSQYLDYEDRAVQALRAKMGTGPRDLWQRAQARATWVRTNLRPDNAAEFGPASKIAQELRGDCRHAALLTAALCRADGVPARTAIGLVYVERNRKPFLGFHMWTEAYIDGAWRGLDGSPGIGGVGVLHLKVTDTSWARDANLVPLQPALRLVGKMNAEVVQIVE